MNEARPRETRLVIPLAGGGELHCTFHHQPDDQALPWRYCADIRSLINGSDCVSRHQAPALWKAALLASALLFLSPPCHVERWMMQFTSQSERDSQRESYSLTFPGDLAAESIQAWLRSTASALRFGTSGFFSLSRDSLVFETWATSSGITHRLLIPSNSAEYITAQLRTHGRGVTVAKDDSRPVVDWNAGSEVSLSRPMSPLQTGRDNEVAASLLGSIQPLQEGETVLIQWVLAPVQEPREASTVPANRGLLRSILFGNETPSNDEVNARKNKLSEANLLGVGRVVARAGHPFRAAQIVHRVESALSSANSAATRFSFKGRGARLISEANQAKTPKTFPAQFNVKELSGIIGFPVGQSFIPGLIRSNSRQLFATADVASEGVVLGDSTYLGHERPIALQPEDLLQHAFITGGPGAGKTSLMHDIFSQVAERGYGAVVVDAAPNTSSETMFSGALKYIPKERIDDVIIVDPTRQSSNPVGLNIFDQLSPEAAASQVMTLFKSLYASDVSGVWLSQLIYHGVYTLAEAGNGLSIVDLMPLLSPQTAEEREWADHLTSSVKSEEVREWWARWKKKDEGRRDSSLEPLANRIWQLTNRREVLDIFGQSRSTFQISDVISQNKILLINLAGLSPDSAKIIGTLVTDAIWSAAQSQTPEKSNFLFMDEFQVMTSSYGVRLDEYLRLARKNKLGLIMATQYLTDGVPKEVRRATINNTKTKVVFRVASEEANIWNAEIDGVNSDDFRNQANHEAIVRIASQGGVADVTMRTRAPRRSYGTERAVREQSMKNYGRPVAEVIAERQSRRVAPETSLKKRKRPPIGIEEW